MKNAVLLLVIVSPLLLLAQTNHSIKGIKWEEDLSWIQIIAKAKAENKYIFLDCFATWCGPCHAMDKEVYIDEKVGTAINEKFISIKVQMDKTYYDNDTIKKWYNDASMIQKNYAVNVFPTFLFFSSDGQPLHRAVGYRDPTEFISLVADALNPEKQYYALLKNYQPGTLDTSELKGLARALAQSGGDLAETMAVEYILRIPRREQGNCDNLKLMKEFSASPKMQKVVDAYIVSLKPREYIQEDNLSLIKRFKSISSVKGKILNYLRNLKKEEIAKQASLLIEFNEDSLAKLIVNKYVNSLKGREVFEKENLQLISAFTKSSKDKGFNIFRENSRKIDEVMRIKGYAMAKIENIIIKEEYDSFYVEAQKKDTDNIPWASIKKSVSDKYGNEIAEFLDIHMKSALYEYYATKRNKYWKEYIKSYIDKIEKNGYDTTHPQIQFLDVMVINNFVYDAIFYHSNDKDQINTGLKWMEGVIHRNPRHANNIDTYANLLYKAGRMKEAIQWQERAVQIAMEEKSGYLPSLQSNLAKMKKGEATWINERVN